MATRFEPRILECVMAALSSEDGLLLVPELLRRAKLGAASVRALPDKSANLIYDLGRRYILRLGRGEDGECFPKAAEILRQAAGTIRAPRVVWTDFTREISPGNVMVCERLDGVPLFEVWGTLSERQRCEVYAAATGELRKLHAMDPYRAPLCGAWEPWPQAFREDIDRRFTIAQGRPRDVPLDAMRSTLDACWPAMESSRPVVVHNDVHWNNILVDDAGQFRGLIDFDDAVIGPEELDLIVMWHFLAGAYAPEQPCIFSKPDLLRDTKAMLLQGWGDLLNRPGFTERYAALCIREIFLILTSDLPGMTWAEAQAEAAAMYEACFIRPGMRFWA